MCPVAPHLKHALLFSLLLLLLGLLLILSCRELTSTILGFVPHLVASLTLTLVACPVVVPVTLVALRVVSPVATLLLSAFVVVSFPLLSWGLSRVSILTLISIPLSFAITGSSFRSTDPFGQPALFHSLISEFVSKSNNRLNGSVVG